MTRKFISPFLLLLSLLSAWYALSLSRGTRTFQDPTAFAILGQRLYVAEKGGNTVLELEHFVPAGPMALKGRYSVERDDRKYYYILRSLHTGPRGLVVHSCIFDRETKDFVGYRFREYSSLADTPRDLFTILLKNPEGFPELHYAFDTAGNHYFANNCFGQRNIWKVPPEGGVVMREGVVPPGVEEMGEVNGPFDSWTSICAGPDGRLYLSSGLTEKVAEYASGGNMLRQIGEPGFRDGRLLAPEEVFFLRWGEDEPEYLTVASTGNRTWVQFDRKGGVVRTISPLKEGLRAPDILVGRAYRIGGKIYSFDLAGKSLIIDGARWRSIREYRAGIGREAIAWYGIAAVILLLAILRPRFAALFRRMRFPLFLKLLLLFIPLLAISGIIAGEWVRAIMKRELEAESVRRSANLALAVVHSLSLSDLEKIQRPEDRESEAYRRIYRTVNLLLDSKEVEYTPGWVLHKIRNARFYFGINNWRGPIYEPEPCIGAGEKAMFLEVLRDKRPLYGHYGDDRGEWFSYLQPILNSGGEVIYILELYRPAEQINRVDREVTLRVGKAVGWTVLAAALLVLIFSYLFTRPLRKLMQETQRVRRGDFDHRLDIRSRDETGELARAFDRMVVDLKKYTEELARTSAEKERIQSELRLAREMQQEILPRVFPPFPGMENVEVVARMEPAREVGGDLYDFFPVDGEHLGVVVADVSGKGAAAGLFMMQARAFLRSSAAGEISPAAVVKRVNRLICCDNPASNFVTMFYLVADINTGEATFCNAGHNPPVVIKGGRAGLLRSKQAHAAVGIWEEESYEDERLKLAPGESIVLYTDGVTEAMNRRNEMFGEKRLLGVMERGPGYTNREAIEELFRTLREFREGAAQFDDITVLFFRFLGSGQGLS